MTAGDGETPAGERPIAEQRVCVTGGAGFIGAQLTRRLLEQGARVTVLDDLSNVSDDQARRRLDPLLESHADRLRFLHASILDPQGLADAMRGANIVYHLAAVSSVEASLADPTRCFDVNTVGTQRVVEHARRQKVSAFVYASTSAVYGTSPPPQSEETPPAPESPYASTKLTGEHTVAAWARAYDMQAACLRLFNVYGPGQDTGDYAAVISAFRDRLATSDPPVIYGDGGQTRDFIFIEDAVDAMMRAATTERPLRGEAINIGTGQSVSINDLARVMSRLAGHADLRPLHAPAREGEVRHSRADVRRARRLLDFSATTSLEEGLSATMGLRDASTTRRDAASG
jgi:UDP-glucose 4-epimerase